MESMLYKILGERIRRLREGRGWTQSDLGDFVGLTRSSIANIESARQKIQLDSLYQIAQTFNVSVHDLLPQMDEINNNDVEKIPLQLQIDKEKYSTDQLEWITKVIIKAKSNEGKL